MFEPDCEYHSLNETNKEFIQNKQQLGKMRKRQQAWATIPQKAEVYGAVLSLYDFTDRV